MPDPPSFAEAGTVRTHLPWPRRAYLLGSHWISGNEVLATSTANWYEPKFARSLVESTVERAWDRWCYAQQHAVRAARIHLRAQIALALAEAAWSNYWVLVQDAERIRERLIASRGRLAGGTSAARLP